MISNRIPFDLPSLPSPSGNNTPSPRKDGKNGLGATPLHGKGSESASPKAEGKAHADPFRREMALAAKAKDFSAEDQKASSVKEVMTSVSSPRQIVEPAKNPKKSDSKKTSPVPTAALPAPVDVWAGFVLPSVHGVHAAQMDTAPAVRKGQTAATPTVKTQQAEGAEKTTGQLFSLLSAIPSKSQAAEKSAGASAESSAPSVSVSIPSPAKPSLTENLGSLKNVEKLNSPSPTDRMEAMVSASSVPHPPLVSGQKNKISQEAARTGDTSREPDFATLSAISPKKLGTGDLRASMESHFTDKAGKTSFGAKLGSEVASVQPLVSTSSSAGSISMVPLPSAPTALPGSPAVVTPSGPALPIGASGWQAALAARAGRLQPGQSLLVRTDPAELGPIQVEATLRAGQGKGLHIQLTVKHSGTAQMLQQGAPVIAQMITTAGAGVPVSVGVTMAPSEQASFSSFTFSQGNPGQGEPGRGAPGTPFGSSTNRTAAVEQKMTESSPAIHTKGFESWV